MYKANIFSKAQRREFIIIVGIILSLLFVSYTGLILIISLVNPYPIDNSLLNSSECILPCWKNLRIGDHIENIDQVMQSIDFISMSKNYQRYIHNNEFIVLWSYHENYVNGINFIGHTINKIKVNPNVKIKISDILYIHGIPDFINTSLSRDQSNTNYVNGYLDIIYLKKGLEIKIKVFGEKNDQTFVKEIPLDKELNVSFTIVQPKPSTLELLIELYGTHITQQFVQDNYYEWRGNSLTLMETSYNSHTLITPTPTRP